MKLIKLTLAPGAAAFITNSETSGDPIIFGSADASTGQKSINLRVTFNAKKTITYFRVNMNGFPTSGDIVISNVNGVNLFTGTYDVTTGLIATLGDEDLIFYVERYSAIWDNGYEQPFVMAGLTTTQKATSEPSKEISKYLPYLPIGFTLRNNVARPDFTAAPTMSYADIYDDTPSYNAAKSPLLNGARQYPDPRGCRAWANFVVENGSYPGNNIDTVYWSANAEGDIFTSGTNTTRVEATITPSPIQEYYADLQLTSTVNTDKDIAIVLATAFDALDPEQGDRDGNVGGVGIHTLSLVRGMGGTGTLFALVYNHGYGTANQIVLVDQKVGILWGNKGQGYNPTESGHAGAVMASKSWTANAVGVRLVIEKYINEADPERPLRITVRTSQVNSTTILEATPYIAIDIKRDHPLLGRFYRASHFGFSINGQASASVKVNTFIDKDRLLVNVAKSGGGHGAITGVCAVNQNSSDVNAPSYRWIDRDVSTFEMPPSRLYYGLTNKHLWATMENTKGNTLTLISRK